MNWLETPAYRIFRVGLNELINELPKAPDGTLSSELAYEA
jgi:hypothetical protein